MKVYPEDEDEFSFLVYLIRCPNLEISKFRATDPEEGFKTWCSSGTRCSMVHSARLVFQRKTEKKNLSIEHELIVEGAKKMTEKYQIHRQLSNAHISG